MAGTLPVVFFGGPMDARDELRRRKLDALPAGYAPWLHLAVPSLVGLGAIAWAVATVAPTPGALAIVPVTFVAANATEWRAHRDLLHQRRWPFQLLYERHTPLHHALYPAHDMAVRSTREWAFVLLPAWGIAVILVAVAPFAALFVALGWTDVAKAFVASCAAYVTMYEWLHLAYHQPADSAIGRLPPIRAMARLHATHHRPEIATRGNFNVTVPLWDLIRGTWVRE